MKASFEALAIIVAIFSINRTAKHEIPLVRIFGALQGFFFAYGCFEIASGENPGAILAGVLFIGCEAIARRRHISAPLK